MKPEEPNKKIPSFEKAKRRLKWKRLLAKKWFFPAVYLAAAALILTLAWVYQGYKLQEVSKTTKLPVSQDTVLPSEPLPKNPTDDNFVLPVSKGSGAEKTMEYYDEATPENKREASLVRYASALWPHSGVDFARKDGKTFDVVAALDGKVIRVEDHPIVGQQVEIQHESGIISVYQSLDDLKVKKGQAVKQGDVIAKAGRNTFEKDAGVHLHFEVRNKQNQTVNPEQYFKN